MRNSNKTTNLIPTLTSAIYLQVLYSPRVCCFADLCSSNQTPRWILLWQMGWLYWPHPIATKVTELIPFVLLVMGALWKIPSVCLVCQTTMKRRESGLHEDLSKQDFHRTGLPPGHLLCYERSIHTALVKILSFDETIDVTFWRCQ